MAQHLELVLFMTYAELRAESERTYAGVAWWIIEPFVHMLVYYLVFEVFFDRGVDDYFAFLLVGLTAWKWIESGVLHSAKSIERHSNLVKQAPLPKLVFPTVAILTNSFKFAASFMVIVSLLWVFGYPPSAAYAALPLLLAVEFLLVAGLAYPLAAVHPFVPDMSILIDNGFRLLFFVSGIFFAGEQLSESAQRWFYLNPLAGLIESYRNVLLYGTAPRWPSLAAVTALSLVGLASGALILTRYDKVYPRLTRV